jgi:hypothetical protein
MLALCKELAKWGVGTMRMDPKKTLLPLISPFGHVRKGLELMLLGSSLLL